VRLEARLKQGKGGDGEGCGSFRQRARVPIARMESLPVNTEEGESWRRHEVCDPFQLAARARGSNKVARQLINDALVCLTFVSLFITETRARQLTAKRFGEPILLSLLGGAAATLHELEEFVRHR
jgi:hypothetical protein